MFKEADINYVIALDIRHMDIVVTKGEGDVPNRIELHRRTKLTLDVYLIICYHCNIIQVIDNKTGIADP